MAARAEPFASHTRRGRAPRRVAAPSAADRTDRTRERLLAGRLDRVLDDAGQTVDRVAEVVVADRRDAAADLLLIGVVDVVERVADLHHAGVRRGLTGEVAHGVGAGAAGP